MAKPAPGRFRRATPEDALNVARDTFVRGERLDMIELSATLGIGRATLYRWVGDRKQLIDKVLASLTVATWAQTGEAATGEGVERALDAMRRFIDLTAEFPPLREFSRREPGLALRILLDPDGEVARRLREGLAAALARDAPDLVVPPETIDVIIRVGTALEWANVAAGFEPHTEGVVRVARAMLRDASSRPARSAQTSHLAPRYGVLIDPGDAPAR